MNAGADIFVVLDLTLLLLRGRLGSFEVGVDLGMSQYGGEKLEGD